MIRHIWYHTWKPVQNWTIGMTSMKPIRELKSSAANVSSRPKGRFISPTYACKGKIVVLEMWQSKPSQYKVGENVRWIIINQGVSNENQSGIDNRRWQDVYIQVQSGLFETIQQGDTLNISKRIKGDPPNPNFYSASTIRIRHGGLFTVDMLHKRDWTEDCK